MSNPAPTLLAVLVGAALAAVPLAAQSADSSANAQPASWPCFRGPGRDGVALGATPPTTWSDTDNVAWRVELPGPGASSPVVAHGRVYVACYSGYGKQEENNGDRSKLVHHLACYDQTTGEHLWTTDVPGPLEKDARAMQINEHGFASPTPVIEGDRVFAYFGHAGVLAFDRESGDILWRTDLGGPDPNLPVATNQVVRNGQTLSLEWGAAASPVTFENLVIVNASEECRSVRAFDQATGDLVWKHDSANLEGTAVPPAIFGEGDDAVLIQTLGGAIWGLDPRTGEEIWNIATDSAGGMSSMAIAQDDVAFVFGGDKSLALHFARDFAGGTPIEDDEGEELDPRVAWTSMSIAIPSPVLHSGKILAVNSEGMGLTIDAKTGELEHRGRLDGRTGGIYASPVLADGKLYVVSREKGTFVYSADGEYELLAHNELEDDAQCNASPAVVGKQLFLRSDRYLYCFKAGAE